MLWQTQTYETQDRQPAVAGRFYPADEQELRMMVEQFFKEAKPKITQNTQAIITPHAGYVFSGPVAASAFNQIDTDKDYENIFLIGTSHVTYLAGASIYAVGDYIMPFGKVKVNKQLAKQLIDKYDFFTFAPEAHMDEHTLEVQLPFLYYKLKRDFQIVPIIVGTNRINVIQQIAEALKPYFNEKNLFVVSTDFSHYPPYEDAKFVDQRTAEAIVSKDPEKFLKVIEENKRYGIPNLATSICGWSATLVLMYLAKDDPNLQFKIIDYKNSGDSIYGDHYQVVGYYAIALERVKAQQGGGTSKDSEFNLTDEDKITLLRISRKTLNDYVLYGRVPEFDDSQFSATLKTPAGAFVTIRRKEDKKLRGCIGRFEPTEPLWKVVVAMTVASASRDPRFNPITPDELDEVEIEISVLTPLRRVDSLDEIEIGKHGVYCRKGFMSGTLLPQVAVEQGWDVEEFVRYCCKHKAGLDWECWKDEEVELYVYEAIVFDESEFGLV